jgi:hypothetical protein
MAVLRDPPAQVDLFVEEEEAMVESTDFTDEGVLVRGAVLVGAWGRGSGAGGSAGSLRRRSRSSGSPDMCRSLVAPNSIGLHT